jgi:hypothetical protein
MSKNVFNEDCEIPLSDHKRNKGIMNELQIPQIIEFT